MMDSGFMDRVKSFFGLGQGVPRNDFRNPIWGSDDDDDGDELYTRQHLDSHTPVDFHREITRHFHDIFKSFGGMFGDMKFFFNDDDFNHLEAFTNTPDTSIAEPEGFDSNKIRDYYLKPGYHRPKRDEPKDLDLDGKISSRDLTGLFKKDELPRVVKPFDGSLVQGMPFCQTVITTSVKKSDGTVETRRIIKRGNEVIEETTTSTEPDRNPNAPGLPKL